MNTIFVGRGCVKWPVLTNNINKPTRISMYPHPPTQMNTYCMYLLTYYVVILYVCVCPLHTWVCVSHVHMYICTHIHPGASQYIFWIILYITCMLLPVCHTGQPNFNIGIHYACVHLYPPCAYAFPRPTIRLKSVTTRYTMRKSTICWPQTRGRTKYR